MTAGGDPPVLLVVDDEPHILAAISRTLRREPLVVVTAGSAAEALGILAGRRIDAVLSDHKMPGMDGTELLRRVGALAPGTARLLITGWTADLEPGRRDELGLVAVIPKPWDDAELRRAVRSALGIHGPAGACVRDGL